MRELCAVQIAWALPSWREVSEEVVRREGWVDKPVKKQELNVLRDRSHKIEE